DSSDQDQHRGPCKRNQPLTQMERMKEMIADCLTTPTETLKHGYLRPWNTRTPYAVHVSQLSKEEEAEQHVNWLNASQGQSVLALYSDASSVPKGTGIGVGLVGFDLAGPTPVKIHTEVSNLGKRQIVYNGEIEGIAQALEYGAQVA
ncbi:hypothetical protein K402DRAFT_302665, partial [Aulographum hederae CBS 113979]